MVNDSSSRAPYAPARALLVPIVSIVISAPTLLIGLLLVISGTYLALFGHSLYASTPLVVQVPVPMCLFLVLGPMAALVLCTSQRTRAEQAYGSSLLLGFRIKRLNAVALWCAALALATLPLITIISAVVNSLDPR